MIVRFVIALLVWMFVGVLVAAEATAQTPPDYSLLAGYGALCVAWAVSYWIRARSAAPRRWWWLGGLPEVVLVIFDRRRSRTRREPRDGEPKPMTVTGRPEHQAAKAVRRQRRGIW